LAEFLMGYISHSAGNIPQRQENSTDNASYQG